MFKSLAPGNASSLFYANSVNKFKAEFRSEGEQVMLVPRLIQTWRGVVIHFHKGKDLLVDYFSLSLPEEEGIQLSTKCGEEYETHWVSNNTLVEMPYFCSAYTSKRVFLRSVHMQRKVEGESEDSMLQRQSKKPLTVKISTNKLEKSINATNAYYKGIEDDLKKHNEEHDHEKNTSIWFKILQWEPITAGIALVVGTIIILLVIKKALSRFKCQYSPVHYGVASLEEVEMMREEVPEPIPRHPSRSSIRTNPHPKRHAAIRNEVVREQLNLQQGQVAGAHRQLSFQEAEKQIPIPPMGYTFTLRPAGAPVDRSLPGT